MKSDFFQREDLRQDEAGLVLVRAAYDKGQTPLWIKDNLAFCGRPEAWLDGAVDGIDAPLVFTPSGLSTCCIAKGTVPIMGTTNYLAKFTGAGDEIIDSRAYDSGAGSFRIDANVSVREILAILAAPGYVGGCQLSSIIDNSGGFALLRQGGGAGASQTGTFSIYTTGNDVIFDFGSIPSGADIIIAVAGQPATNLTTGGWDVRSGLVFAVPDSSDLATTLGLGSAAYADTGDFDPAGEAASEVGDHEAEADPHPDYLLESDAATTYMPLGGTWVEAYLTSNQALTQSAWNALTGWTEGVDDLGEFNATTGVFSPSETGLYEVDFSSALGGAAGRSIAAIRTTAPAVHKTVADGTLILCGGMCLVRLASGTSYTFDLFPTDPTVSALGGASNTALVIRRRY